MNGLDQLVRPSDPETTPLDQLDVSNPYLYERDIWQPYFARLRREEPVHWRAGGIYGDYWSVTRYRDIEAVDTNHKAFSSDAHMGGIVLRDVPPDLRRPSFIAMDEPKHTDHRRAVAPFFGQKSLPLLAETIRTRAGRILDELPRGETFDWVDRVAIELTTQMLATLFDFPFAERRRLAYWSMVASANKSARTDIDSEAQRNTILDGAMEEFATLFYERQRRAPRPDLLSMLAHGEATRDLPTHPAEFLGTIMLLVVAGNDTTRNTISGGLLALNEFPDQWRKLRENPALVTSMVPEMIRWQTPVIHMRRTALMEVELGGKRIRAGDKVAMWYISGNRDEAVITRPDAFVIDRPDPNRHLSFGWGVHRCLGRGLAEMQVQILWEEILRRGWDLIEVMGPPVRAYTNVLRSIRALPVRIPG